MFISVYAICKNEAAFARRWMASMSEADEICVLDTGSTDGTPELLRSLGAHVEVETFEPWRFDSARNRSLALVSPKADLCVCTDLDEVFHAGWRKAMEEAWQQGAEQLRYRYTWSFRSDGSEGCVFYIEKAHAPKGFRWVNPVHEVLQWQGIEPHRTVTATGVQLDHHSDPTKSRGQYLPLLELSVEEDPENDRNMHYLGREYFFHGQWQKAVDTLLRHLSLKRALWADERCASMRYIARALEQLGCGGEAERWFVRAAGEAPWLREPWLDWAQWAYRQQRWALCLGLSLRALDNQHRGETYISTAECWGSLPYDLAALSCWQLERYPEALKWGKKAFELEPQSSRLAKNLSFYRSRCTTADVESAGA